MRPGEMTVLDVNVVCLTMLRNYKLLSEDDTVWVIAKNDFFFTIEKTEI